MAKAVRAKKTVKKAAAKKKTATKKKAVVKKKAAVKKIVLNCLGLSIDVSDLIQNESAES